MLALMSLYLWTMLAGAVAAPALALLGVQLATRDRSMQTLCVGQGAMVGVLVGIGATHYWNLELFETFGPFITAIGVSALTFLVTDLLVEKKSASKNTTFAFIFALLLAMGYLISSLFPGLESHMAQVYFGDLATLTTVDSKITLFASVSCLAILTFFGKAIANQSFEWAIFGGSLSLGESPWGLRGFKLITLVMLCFSVQFVGFLFTIAMLFLPTALMNFLHTKGLRIHLVLCAVIATISTAIGFVVSLRYTRLPTVPTIVVTMFLFALVIVGTERFALLLAGASKALKKGEWRTKELARA